MNDTPQMPWMDFPDQCLALLTRTSMMEVRSLQAQATKRRAAYSSGFDLPSGMISGDGISHEEHQVHCINQAGDAVNRRLVRVHLGRVDRKKEAPRLLSLRLGRPVSAYRVSAHPTYPCQWLWNFPSSFFLSGSNLWGYAQFAAPRVGLGFGAPQRLVYRNPRL